MIPADDGRCNEIGQLRQREEEAQHQTASRTSRDRTSHDPLPALSRESTMDSDAGFAMDRRWTATTTLERIGGERERRKEMPERGRESEERKRPGEERGKDAREKGENRKKTKGVFLESVMI